MYGYGNVGDEIEPIRPTTIERVATTLILGIVFLLSSSLLANTSSWFGVIKKTIPFIMLFNNNDGTLPITGPEITSDGICEAMETWISHQVRREQPGAG